MTNSPAHILLALDTSTRSVGLALYDGFQVMFESSWTSKDYHTVELAPAVQEAFRKASLSREGIGALAVALGPGSFTGLRIGLALAKGIALARHLPIVGIPSLDILAAAQPILELPLAVVLRAGRGRLAVGWYAADQNAWQPVVYNPAGAQDPQPMPTPKGDVDLRKRRVEVCTLQELAGKFSAPAMLCGEMNGEEREFLRQACPALILARPAQSLRRPGYLAELGWKRWREGRVDDPASLSPLYLHYNDSIPE